MFFQHKLIGFYNSNGVSQCVKRFMSGVTIQVSPKVSLVDQKVKTIVTGLRPAQKGKKQNTVKLGYNELLGTGNMCSL
jgi:hypothetical protein